MIWLIFSVVTSAVLYVFFKLFEKYNIPNDEAIFYNYLTIIDYELTILEGKFANLLSRCIIVLDENHKVVYTTPHHNNI